MPRENPCKANPAPNLHASYIYKMKKQILARCLFPLSYLPLLLVISP